MLYRPFLHYVAGGCQHAGIDKRSYACAAAGVSVSRNIVHITAEMKKRGLLIGAFWFTMYTTYFAILSLVFFVLENPESPTGQEILKDAMEGKDTLAGLAKRSMAADRCSKSLAVSLHCPLPFDMADVCIGFVQGAPRQASRATELDTDYEHSHEKTQSTFAHIFEARACMEQSRHCDLFASRVLCRANASSYFPHDCGAEQPETSIDTSTSAKPYCNS